MRNDGVDLWSMDDRNADITEIKIVAIDNKNLNVKYETLKENMQVGDFKEWWFDNGRCNQLPN